MVRSNGPQFQSRWESLHCNVNLVAKHFETDGQQTVSGCVSRNCRCNVSACGCARVPSPDEKALDVGLDELLAPV